MDINQKLTEELEVKRWQIDAAVNLIDEGNTIPFISRYRKEVTGSLNDEQLRKLYERLVYLRNLEEKKEQVISSIEEQGKMTEELKAQILAAETQVAVEDLYRPYRPKRRTRATIAKEKGLEPFAAYILLQQAKEPLEETAKAYITAGQEGIPEEKEVKTADEAVQGALDIIVEGISDNADYRSRIRKLTMQKGKITSVAKDADAESVYEMYYEFEEPVSKLAGHRILALNRGEKEKFLTVKVEAPEEDILRYLEKQTIHRENPYTTPALKATVAHGAALGLVGLFVGQEPLVAGGQEGVLPGLGGEGRLIGVGAPGQGHQDLEALALLGLTGGVVQGGGVDLHHHTGGDQERLGQRGIEEAVGPDLPLQAQQQDEVPGAEVDLAVAVVLQAVELGIVAVAPAQLDRHAAVSAVGQLRHDGQLLQGQLGRHVGNALGQRRLVFQDGGQRRRVVALQHLAVGPERFVVNAVNLHGYSFTARVG